LSRPKSENKSDLELVRKTEDDGVYPSPLTVKAVRLDRIVPDDGRPARAFSDESLGELGRSLLLHGQVTPIVVQYLSDDDVFVLIDGERRWRAAQKVGLRTLVAVILSRLTPEERYDRQMAVALHQEAWGSGDRLEALERYKARRALISWAGVAAALGLSESRLSDARGEAPAQTQNCPPPAGSTDTLSIDVAAQQTVDATRRLEEVYSRWRPGRSEGKELAQALEELAGLVSSQRARMERSRKRSAAKGKPVEHLPTWG
jgi:ParB/RepB/Spo0J family partition protein